MVEMILLKGADPLIKDSRGGLAVELAEYHGLSAVTARLRPLSGSPANPQNEGTESGLAAESNRYVDVAPR